MDTVHSKRPYFLLQPGSFSHTMRSAEKLSQALISGLYQCVPNPPTHCQPPQPQPHPWWLRKEQRGPPHTPGRSGRRSVRGGALARGGGIPALCCFYSEAPSLKAPLWPSAGSRKVSPASPLPQPLLACICNMVCQRALSPSSPTSSFSFPAPGRVKPFLLWLGRNLGASGGLDPHSGLGGTLSAPITQLARVLPTARAQCPS